MPKPVVLFFFLYAPPPECPRSLALIGLIGDDPKFRVACARGGVRRRVGTVGCGAGGGAGARGRRRSRPCSLRRRVDRRAPTGIPRTRAGTFRRRAESPR